MDHIMEHALDSKICPMCKFTSDQDDEICDHIELHAKSDMYFCDYCANIYMSEETLNEHFMESHSEELCSIGEEGVEYVVENPPKEKETAKLISNLKRGRKPASSAEAPSKKFKKDIISENEIEGASFVEYEEIAEVDEAEEEMRKPETKKEVSPQKPMRIKMSQKEIKRLQKEGKITMQNGMLVMKN
jgi:anaerobic selenocysteine-containing dehydrogenase